jgi:hypothetical protein
MLNMSLALRWIGALVCALMIFVLVLAVGAVIWRQFGTNAASTIRLSECLAAGAAVLGGALVVPRSMARSAALVIWALALAFPGYVLAEEVLTGRFEITALWQFADLLLGGFSGYYIVRSGGLGPERRRLA